MEQLEQAHLARIQAEQTCLARITAVDTAARTKEMRQSGSHIDWGKARVEVLAVAGTGPATEKQVSRDNVPPTSAIANTTPTSVDTISDAVQQEEHHNPEMRRNSKEEEDDESKDSTTEKEREEKSSVSLYSMSSNDKKAKSRKVKVQEVEECQEEDENESIFPTDNGFHGNAADFNAERVIGQDMSLLLLLFLNCCITYLYCHLCIFF